MGATKSGPSSGFHVTGPSAVSGTCTYVQSGCLGRIFLIHASMSLVVTPPSMSNATPLAPDSRTSCSTVSIQLFESVSCPPTVSQWYL